MNLSWPNILWCQLQVDIYQTILDFSQRCQTEPTRVVRRQGEVNAPRLNTWYQEVRSGCRLS